MNKRALIGLYFIFGLFRFLTAQENALDHDFSGDGIAILPSIFSGNTAGRSLGVQSDGKIIVGNTVKISGVTGYGLIRLKQDGRIDSLFGVNGSFQVNFGNDYNIFRAFTIQPDDKIVSIGFSGNNDTLGIVRQNADGSLDQGFGNQGIVKTVFTGGDSRITAIAIQPDGKIIAGGQAGLSSLLIRYWPTGKIDSTFGDNGAVLYQVSNTGGGIENLLVQPDGKILTTGFILNDPNGVRTFINRFEPNGSIDLDFGINGLIKPTFSLPQVYSGKPIILMQADEKIVIGTRIYLNFEFGHFGLARFNANGSPDESFGTQGSLTFGISGENLVLNALSIQQDGKIIASGMELPNLTPNSQTAFFAIARFESNGSLDVTFGSNGFRSTMTENLIAVAPGPMTLQGDGKILLLGTTNTNGTAIPVLLRFLASTIVGVHDQLAANFSAKLFPNPANQQTTLQFELPQAETLTVQLLDMTGRILTTVVNDHAENQGSHSLDIPFPTDLPGGMYMLRILSAHGQISLPVMHF